MDDKYTRSLEKLVALLDHALRWYTDSDNYTDEGVPGRYVRTRTEPGAGTWEADYGERARQALAEAEELALAPAAPNVI